MVTSFTNYGDPDPLKYLASVLSNLGAPLIEDDEKFLVLVAWESSDAITSTLDLREVRHFDELVDGLNMIDMSHLEFGTPTELVDQLLQFSGQFLDVNQQLTLAADPSLLLKVNYALKAVRENGRLIQNYADSLYQELYMVRWQGKRIQRQVNAISKLYAEKVVLPSLFEQLPDKFCFGPSDLLAKTPVFVTVMENMEVALSRFGLVGDGLEILRRAFTMAFVDQVNAAQSAQQPADWEPVSKLFAAFLLEKRGIERACTPGKESIIKKASSLFKKIKKEGQMSVSLAMLFNAMTLLQMDDDMIVALAIANSYNLDLFGVLLFAKGFLSFHDEVTTCIFSENEQMLLRRFAKALELIQLAGKVSHGSA
jgi:hypothetical protein